MDKRFAWLLLAGLLVAGAWLWWYASENAGTATSQPSAATDAGEPGAPAAADLAAADAGQTRAPASAASAPTTQPAASADATGELVIHVVFAGGEPAPGVRVYVGRSFAGLTVLQAERITDAAGTARAEVPAGKAAVSSDRGGRVEATVVSGQRNEARLKLEPGVEVAGVVRDVHGAPVAGADVWLTSFQAAWAAGAFVAKSDASGEFRLREAPASQSVGAVAAGFAPSPLIHLEQRDPTQTAVRVTLVLSERGGALAGRVTDERGEGVAGAMVAVGSPRRLFDHGMGGRLTVKWAPRRVVTGTDGRYVAEGLAPGKHPVEVWTPARPRWRGDCSIVADATSTLDIVLPRGVTVHGTVRTEDGAPLEGANVRAFPAAIDESFLQGGQYDFESTFGYPIAATDAAGSYRLRNVAPGAVHLYAGKRAERNKPILPWASEVRTAAAGEELEWSPRLEPGPTIVGSVRHRDAVPMPNVFVTVSEPGSARRQSLTTDAQGRFRFVRLEKKPYDVSVQLWSPPKGAPPVEARNVWPHQCELELVAAFDAPKKVAPGTVSGRIVDAAGRLPQAGALSVILPSDRGFWKVNGKLDGAAFRFSDVEPGRYRIVALAGEDPILYGPWFDVQAAEQKDVGALTTEPAGSLRLTLVRGPGTEELQPTLWLTPAGGGHGRKVESAKGTELVIDNLCAGEYGITGYVAGMAAPRGRCTVVAGGEVRASIELRAAVAREIVVEYAADQQLHRIRITGSQDPPLLDYSPERTLERPYRITLQLPLGRLRCEVETKGGGKAHQEFEMTSLAAGQPPVVLRAQ